MTTLKYESEKSSQFDIWGLIKRANTADPYILMAKHRMNQTSTRRPHTAGRVLTRRRRRESEMVESLADDSLRSHTSSDTYELDGVPTDDYDYDADDDGVDGPGMKSNDHCQDVYLRACREYNVGPAAHFRKALKTDRAVLRHRQLGISGVKACAVALVSNSSIQKLDLTDNDMKAKGAEHLADMLKENIFITDLNLSDNDIGAEGARHIVNVVKQLDPIHRLDLSGNGLRECDAEVIRPLIEDTLNLKHLNLSHNQFREAGGDVIGEALVWNDTMETLDLSWNHLRRDGGVALAEGLAENTCLKTLNLSWNGFYLDGCRALAKALEENQTLIELDLSCNRINKDVLEKLMFGLRKNTTLEILRLGLNPLTSDGANMLLEFIRDTKTSGIKELDLSGQLVDPPFVALVGEIEATRSIKVIYGQVRGQEGRGDDDDERQLMDENPIIVLMEFGKLMGFRLMDLFSALDKDGSKSLDHHEIKTGLRMVNIPLSDKCIDILIEKLDVDGDGEIDFGELMAAQTEHRKKMSKFFAAQEGDIDIADTEIGRVRVKLSRLMAKHMSGNPAFKRRVEQMMALLESGDASKLTQTLNAAVGKQTYKSKDMPPASKNAKVALQAEKNKTWKPLAPM